MHNFIYEKKARNNPKYRHESRLNSVALPVPKGTVSLMLNTQRKKNQMGIAGRRLTGQARFKLKWKTIQWLSANKKEAIECMLAEKRELFAKFCLFYPDVQTGVIQKMLRKPEFRDLLLKAGLGEDFVLMDKLF